MATGWSRAATRIWSSSRPVEALRLKPARLFVIRRGEVIAETPAVASRLILGGQMLSVDFRHEGGLAGSL